MNKLKITVLLIIGVLSLNSCIEDTDTSYSEPKGNYEHGFYIVNEGPFFNGNGSITYVSTDFSTVEQNVYENVNGEALGNIVQSMTIADDKAYIVVNNSHKIVVANPYTMEKITAIEEGLNNPRYMVISGDYAYISNWGEAFDPSDDYIAVMDLNMNEITQTISVSEGPEKMEVIGNKLYVAMQGGWGFNNKITVIDTNSKSVETTIEVGYVPNSMVVKDDALYVLSGGIPSWSWTLPESEGKISKIDANTQTITQTWDFATTEHPSFLSFDGENILYYLNANVYKWNGDENLPTIFEEGLGGYYYGMMARNGLLFTLNAGDFASEGELKVFQIEYNREIRSIQTGIIPNSIQFN